MNTGWLHLVPGENDAGYHMQISDSSTSGDLHVIVEVADLDCASSQELADAVYYRRSQDYL
jgi:hypothetical protein